MALTSKQANDLHQAIFEYLSSQPSLIEVSVKLKEAIDKGVPENDGVTTNLEKKWVSVVRLQKKVMDLQAKIKDIENEKHLMLKHPSSKGGDPSFVLKTTATHRLVGHRGPITCVTFHPIYNLVASGSEDACIKLYDFETGEYEETLKGHTNSVQDVCFNMEGSLLASCSSDVTIKLWDFSSSGSYRCIKTLAGHDHNVSGVAFLKGSKQLISCSRDKLLKVWDVDSGYCIKTLAGHSEWVRKVAVDLETNTVASCSSDHSIIIWDVHGAETVCRLQGHEHVVECLAFSSSAADKVLGTGGKKSGGLHIVSGSRDKTIKIWNISSVRCVVTLTGHESWVRGVAFQPQGKHLVSVSEDKSIMVWDVKQQRCIRQVAGAHSHFVSCLAIHDSIGLVATGSVDKELAIWQAAPSIV